MNLTGIILLVLVGLLAVYVFFPGTFNDGKDWVFEKIGIHKSTTTNEFPEDDNSIIINNQTINQTKATPIIIKNKCGFETFGMPDYTGTTMAGKGCDDVFEDYDLSCLANAPHNYPGTINLADQTSNPPITCCMKDGTCQWNITG